MLHRTAIPALSVFVVAMLCASGSAFAFSATFSGTPLSSEVIGLDYAYVSSGNEFEFEKGGISSGSDVVIIDGLPVSFGELSVTQSLGTMYFVLSGLSLLDGKTVSLSAAPASDPSSMRSGVAVTVSDGSVTASVDLDGTEESWLIYLTVYDVTSSVSVEGVSFDIVVDVSDGGSTYSTTYSATGTITMGLTEIIIRPSEESGSEDVAESINDNGVGVVGTIGEETKDGFKADPSGGITYGGEKYPSSYICFDKTHNVGTAGKSFEVTFVIPAGLEFGIKMNANHLSKATVTVGNMSVEYDSNAIFGWLYTSEQYVGTDGDGNLVISDQIQWMKFDEPVTITISGTMNPNWMGVNNSSFKVEVYMMPTEA